MDKTINTVVDDICKLMKTKNIDKSVDLKLRSLGLVKVKDLYARVANRGPFDVSCACQT